MTLLKVKKLRKEFKANGKGDSNLVAVADIEFEVHQGEIFGLLGPNAAGKTTTISMLSGTLTPTSGTAEIAGFDLNHELLKIKEVSGIVPQSLALYLPLSGLDNLEFMGGLYSLKGKTLRNRINEVLEIVSLTDRAHDKVSTYSGGMKRRLNLAAGLLHRPKILYLDEPTAGVDPQSRNHIFESIKRLVRDYNMAVVYTSHYMEEVQALCDRVAIMDLGEIVASDSVKNLIKKVEGSISIGVLKKDKLVMQKLKLLPDIDKIKKSEGKISITTKNCTRSLPKILSTIKQLEVKITSIEILEPNLESVFLKLTGKQLRD